LAASIFETKKYTAGEHFKGPEAERQVELQRLERLASQLAKLGEK
jgi:hypothetical protein